MTPRRSPHLHRINLLIGFILVISGVAGGFLLTFWFLILLLPITCVAASWMMAWTAIRAREGHSVAAMILTVLFGVWFVYFLQNGAEMPTWYGIFLMWTLLMLQGAFYLSGSRPQTDPVRWDPD
jgi:CDP-diglyceride synthetase